VFSSTHLSLTSVVKERSAAAKGGATVELGSGGGATSVGERLLEFRVTGRGAMIAVYNCSAQSSVIKIKSVANRLTDDWHFLLRSEVSQRH